MHCTESSEQFQSATFISSTPQDIHIDARGSKQTDRIRARIYEENISANTIRSERDGT